MLVRVAKKMTRFRFRTACLLGIGVIASAPTSGHARRSPLEVPSLPHVNEISPLGVRRGFASRLTVRGSALSGNPRLIAPFRFAVETPTLNDSDATTFKVRITVDPATPLGVYPIRVLTDEGLSVPFPLAVGQLPQIQEKEDNNNIDLKANEADWTAQRIVLPTVIEGELPEGDYDYFRFQGQKGQRIVADILGARIGSGIDIDLHLGSLDRQYQATVHLLSGDPADTPLFGVLPSDGEYLFGALRAFYRPIKGGRSVYRLTVGALPAAAEVYPLGGRRGETIRVELRGGTLDRVTVVPVTLAPDPGESIVRLKVPTTLRGPDGLSLDVEALPPLLVGDLPEVLEPTDPDGPPPKATPPVVFNGRIDPRGDEDRFMVVAKPGQRFRVAFASFDLGSALHPRLKIRDSLGNDLVAPSAYTVPARLGVLEYASHDPSVEFTVPAGETEVTIVLAGTWTDPPHPDASGSMSRGGSGHAYRIRVVPMTPGFSIALNDAQVSVPRGGKAAVSVTVCRDGFNGPIALRLVDPPAGLEFRPGVIAEGQTVGALTLAAAANASFGPLLLDVIGEGRGRAGPIITRAIEIIAFGQPTTEAFRYAVDQIDGKPVYQHFPAYLRTRILTQTGLYVATTKADPRHLDSQPGRSR